jgi:hypothetical protein
MSWRTQRVDVLDLAVVVCGIVGAVVGRPLIEAGYEGPALMR